MHSARAALRFLELLTTLLSFGAVYGIYLALFKDALPMQSTLVACFLSALAFWAATQLKDRTQDDSTPSMIFVEQFCFGAGVSLLTHALLTYGFLVRRTPFLVVGSSLVAATFLTAIRHFGRRHLRKTPRILLLGFDGLTASLLPELGFPVQGICGTCEVPPPPGIQILGDAGDLAEVLAQTRPTHILIGAPGWERALSPELLLRCRMEGVRVMEASGLYEKLLLRVCCERLQPVDLMLSSVLRGDSRTMAIQAVYNNLLGLFLLLFLAPLILLIALVSALTSGGGVIESIECAGFQYIPFRLQRFRTTRADGSVTPVGKFLRRFRLVNLPQLINVVRGDMALVGPRPVRTEFAHHLSEVMPFYAHRFSVKPGLTGWAQAHLSERDAVDTRLEIEYDLYYVKEGSLWLDLEILFDRLVGKTAAAGA